MDEAEIRWLRAAIEQARRAVERGDEPYGAVLVDEHGTVLGEAGNTTVSEHDCTGHAELNLVRAASGQFGPGALARCTLYASTEPCAMCAGAIYWSGVGRVVYASSGEQVSAVLGSAPELAVDCRAVLARGRRPVEVIGPVLAEEALRVFEGRQA